MKQNLLITAAMILTLIATALPTYAATGGSNYIHIEHMTMEFEDHDAVVTLSYDLNLFADMYVFILGSYNLEPTFEKMFSDFESVEVTKIGWNSATIRIKDVSRKVDAYYLHDSRELGMNVKTLTIVYPDGSAKDYPDSKSTPNIFYT